MSDLSPSTESVATLVAQFERELGAAKTARDAQSVRDRYLGRKNSVVASWMQLIASAVPAEKKNIGRYANELKQAIDARWTVHEEAARDAAPSAFYRQAPPENAAAFFSGRPFLLFSFHRDEHIIP